jgi:hypothetical protein
LTEPHRVTLATETIPVVEHKIEALGEELSLPVAPNSRTGPAPAELSQARQVENANVFGPKPLVPTVNTAPVAPAPWLKRWREPSRRAAWLSASGASRDERPQREHAQHADEAPVHVSIGRIEVAASTTAAPAKRAAAPRKQTMSLDDYLAQRQGKAR